MQGLLRSVAIIAGLTLGPWLSAPPFASAQGLGPFFPSLPAAGNDSSSAADDADTDAPPVSIPSNRRPTAEEIEALRTRLKTLNLPAAEFEQAQKHYQDALLATTELAQFEAKLEEYSNSYQPIEDPKDPNGHQKNTVEWYQSRLDRPIREVINLQTSDLTGDPIEVLSERASRLERHADEKSKQVKQLESQPLQNQQWLNDLPARLQAIEQERGRIAEGLAQLESQGGAGETRTARRMALLQRDARLAAELEAISAREEAIKRASKLHPLELELTRRKAEAYQQEVATLREALRTRRAEEVEDLVATSAGVASANQQLIGRNTESLGQLLATNESWATELQTSATTIDQARSEREVDVRRYQSLEKRFKDISLQFTDGSRLTQEGGRVLREQLRSLPDLAQLRREHLNIATQKDHISFRRFVARTRLDELSNIDDAAADFLRQVEPSDREAARPVVVRMLKIQKEILERLVPTLDSLDAELSLLLARKNSLIETTDAFKKFIAERDLWVRSADPLHPRHLLPASRALMWSFDPSNWVQTGEELLLGAQRQPLVAGALVLVLGALLTTRRKARASLRAAGQHATNKTNVEFSPSLKAVWLTLLVCLPYPLIIGGLGWLLSGPMVVHEFTRALAQALQVTTWCLLLAEFLRQCCRAEGLADAHLGWPREPLMQMRRYLRWVPTVIIPLVLWCVGLESQTTEPLWGASLGRAIYIAILLLLSLAIWRIFWSHSSAVYQALHRRSEGWLANAHHLWRPLLLAVPLALAGLAWSGYYYTAQQLTIRVMFTVAILLVLLLCAGLFQRWVLLSRRRVAREQTRQRRAQAIAAAEAAAANSQQDDVAARVELPDVTEETVDLTALSLQMRKLLHVLLVLAGGAAFLFVWQDMFDALTWLDETTLPWVTKTEGATTWGHLLKFLIACVVTFAAVRDLPGLLELVVLQHLPIEQGARYAISTLARYGILITGIVVAANLLGITGSSIGWLVAAMGVGLGFGLQEIFANFVSGVIILFERPVRVGDIITLGEKTGLVSRIRMRATTIIDWDRKEYIVPNKDLVTERLLNWSLSDQTNRVSVKVGVAYGSDTEKACDLLREAAAECPAVLENPPPVAFFESFGEGTLNLVLHTFLPTLDKRIETMHRLHTTIAAKFKEAGLDIAIRQQDIHLRSLPPEWHSPIVEDRPCSNGHPEPVPKRSTPDEAP